MGFLDRFFGSDLRLTRPVFTTAEDVDFDFSCNRIKIKNPPQTAQINLNPIIRNINIYSTDEYLQNEEGNYSKNFYTRGWFFFGKRKEPKGSVIVSTAITYDPPEHVANKNNFISKDLNESVLEHCHALWGFQNKGAKPGNLGNGFYQYPISPEEVSTIKINNIKWRKASGGPKGEAPALLYVAPLTSRHTVFFLFKVAAYRGVDFFSEETNLKDTSFGVVDDFMKHVFIEHSEQAKAELEASRRNKKKT